jgi:predicted metal-dependent hydrolase
MTVYIPVSNHFGAQLFHQKLYFQKHDLFVAPNYEASTQKKTPSRAWVAHIPFA